jgi:hypothetical protein
VRWEISGKYRKIPSEPFMVEPSAAIRARYAFGPYVVDTANRRLTRDDETVPVTARVFDILVVLVQQPGQPLDKDTLIARVWGDTAVEEGNLARSVSAGVWCGHLRLDGNSGLMWRRLIRSQVVRLKTVERYLSRFAAAVPS